MSTPLFPIPTIPSWMMNDVDVLAWYSDPMGDLFCFRCEHVREGGLCEHLRLLRPSLMVNPGSAHQPGSHLNQGLAYAGTIRVTTCIDPRLTVLRPGEVQNLYFPAVSQQPSEMIPGPAFGHSRVDDLLHVEETANLAARLHTIKLVSGPTEEEQMDAIINWTPPTVEAGNALGLSFDPPPLPTPAMTCSSSSSSTWEHEIEMLRESVQALDLSTSGVKGSPIKRSITDCSSMSSILAEGPPRKRVRRA